MRIEELRKERRDDKNYRNEDKIVYDNRRYVVIFFIRVIKEGFKKISKRFVWWYSG